MQGMTPDDQYPFSLPIHRHLPKAQRPTFYARYLTRGEAYKVESMTSDLTERVMAAEDTEAVQAVEDAKLVELLLFILVRWERVRDKDGKPLELGEAGLRAVIAQLDPADAWGIYHEARGAVRVRREELGNSD